jgi:pyruvate dehydrogenase E1 component beta subunit
MSQVTVNQAIQQALAEEMRRDSGVILFGEGVATHQHDLVAEFGAERVRNTPLAEGIIAGTAVGAAATGLRPVIDLLFAPFLCFSMEEIVNSAGKLRYLSGGQFSFPLVVLARTGSGWGVGAQHNHNVESWFVHAPGLKVVMPSTAADYKGLLKAAIRDDNPVIFFNDIALGFETGEVPDSDEIVPLGKAAVRREGTDVTLIAYAKSVHACLKAADRLAELGISAAVIDLRSLKPLDEDAILEAVRQTGRVIVVHEAGRMCGVGAEVSSILAEKAFADLKAPVIRLTGPDAPPPASFPLEQAFAPQPEAIVESAARLVRGGWTKAAERAFALA